MYSLFYLTSTFVHKYINYENNFLRRNSVSIFLDKPNKIKNQLHAVSSTQQGGGREVT